jgi:hypothetical protein
MRARPLLLLALASAVALAACAGPRRPQPAKAKPKPDAGRADRADKPGKAAKAEKADINDLNFEVTALQMLHYFDADPGQLRALAKLAPATAAKPAGRKEVKVSARLRRALVGLRRALLTDADDERLNDAAAEFEELCDKEEPDFDDFEPNAEARKEAPAVLRKFTAPQLASFVSAYRNDVRDPRQMLQDALQEARKLTGEKWQKLLEDVSEQAAALVAGSGSAGEEKLRARVKALLTRAHRFKDDKEMAAKKAELDKEVAAIVADAEPIAVLRHFCEHMLAELLSNPQLAAAIDARLKLLGDADQPAPKKKETPKGKRPKRP